MIANKVRVAVLRGGPSSGYKSSLKTGSRVLSLLREMDHYEPQDIFISKDGEWHRHGLVDEPHRILRHADVVWNAMHGSYGEDGRVQQLLTRLKIPFTGSSILASAAAMNKDIAKKLYRQHGLLTPAHEVLVETDCGYDKLVNVFRKFLPPMVVKPASATGSLGVHLAYTFPELEQAVLDALNYSPKILIEEFINGDEVSCAAIENAKGERIYALLPYGRNGLRLKTLENKHIAEMAKRAHEILGLSHYSSSDFIITPRRKVYILETNSHPVLHEESLTNQALEATGWQPRDFVNHIIQLAV